MNEFVCINFKNPNLFYKGIKYYDVHLLIMKIYVHII